MEILWDGLKAVDIRMPHAFKGKLCGICGEIDDDVMYVGDHDVTHANDHVGCPTKAASKDVGEQVRY
jgi:hypothetical protein